MARRQKKSPRLYQALWARDNDETRESNVDARCVIHDRCCQGLPQAGSRVSQGSPQGRAPRPLLPSP